MDIYSIGDGAFLEQVITAVTLLAGSGEFASMAKIGLLFGAILLLFQGLSSGGRGINIGQLGIAGLLYALMFGGTQTVTITDAYTQEVRVVDNVPNGVAATGSFLTSIGYNITQLFETGFSAPTMTQQGYAFSLDVLKRVRMHSLTEFHLGNANQAVPGSDFYESWIEYIKTCTLIGMEIGQIEKNDFMSTPDFMSGLRFQSPNYHALIHTTDTPEGLACTPAFDLLEAYTIGFFLPAFKEDVLPGVLGLQQPAGAAEVEQVINDALNGLGVGPAPLSNITANAPPVTADDFILSSVLVPIYYEAVRRRYVQDGKFSYADQIDDSVRARNSQWMANQSLFDRYLRPMLTFVEGFMFAATPILALLIPVGAAGIGAAGRFLLVGAWIQLWMPALAIVNLFLHSVVAGKMAALADAGSPLTSLAGLHQGDDIVQTWLGTGGLMASAVPVLTLMIVYGGAISANFFATRLQGEDVVMERQAAGATFNPYERLHVDPRATFDRTAGIATQTGAEARLATFNWSASAGESYESAHSAQMAASEQFSSDLRQSLGKVWTDQQSASVGQGFNQRIVAEGSRTEAAIQSHFEDDIRNISASTGMSKQDATQYAAGIAAGLGVSQLKAGINASASDQETLADTASIHEGFTTNIADKIENNANVSAKLNEAMAADLHGETSDALISAETLGQDETLSASAQDVLSTSASYSETVRSGAAMEASRTMSAKQLISAIARSPEAMRALDNVVQQNRLVGEVETYKNLLGERDAESFDGREDLAHLYAQAYVASRHIGTGEERSDRIETGLADVFNTAEGMGAPIGDSTANSGLMVDAPFLGGVRSEVEPALAAGPAGADQHVTAMEARGQGIIDQQTQVGPAHQGHLDAVEQHERENLGAQNDHKLTTHEARERAWSAVDLDGPVGTVEKTAEGLGDAADSIGDLYRSSKTEDRGDRDQSDPIPP